jgi:hypothetical protein
MPRAGPRYLRERIDLRNLHFRTAGWETLNFSRQMSRGLGRVGARLKEIFEEAPAASFSTSELCKLVYRTEPVLKKHRVAVLRALRTLARQQHAEIWFLVLHHEKADTEWLGNRCPYRPKAACRLR